MPGLFLGLDCSTQSLTAVIANEASIKYRKSINFDNDLPHYQTKNGIIFLDNQNVIHSYPLMWIEALELLFNLIQKDISITDIAAISGSGQQHGTVYLNKNFESTLQTINPRQSLKEQLNGCFSRETSPIWMDSSTSKQCEEIRTALGGMKETIRITGSNTFERFSGPQIRKFYQENPQKYNETQTIHLVSSFMASILLGKNAPIDHGDGAGMNLMNIKTKKWDLKALNATAPNLEPKLPELVNSYDIIGKLSPYFVRKYGFNSNVILTPWSGDNPNSLIGVGLINKGKVAISLGTSDTYFAYLKNLYVDLQGEGHVFVAPTGDYMSLICYKNGSLAREKIKDSFNLSWSQFSEILTKTPPGNSGKIMLPYFFSEIVPLVLEPKVYRLGFTEKDIDANVRAIIESQFLSMRLHSKWIEEKSFEIYATGGASSNTQILQIAADIFNTPIHQFDITDSAALGAALRALKSYYDFYHSSKSWEKIVKKFLEPKEIISPNPKNKKLYDDMLELYKNFEDFILRNGEDPTLLQKSFIKKYFNL